jgi:DNA-binding IclR family transcriptional regulator
MPRPRSDPDPDTPKVLDKALRVLESFGGSRDRWTEADLRRHLAMPSTSLNRILRGLERAGYLLRDDAGAYGLGIGAVRLGNRARASIDLPGIVDAELHRLATATGELVLFAVPALAEGVACYVAAVDSPQRLRVTAELGTRIPLTAGATARSILAFAPAARIDEVLVRPRERLARGTMMTEPEIRRALESIRSRGWGISWQETFDGAWALGAPILDDDGAALAAIGVAAPISRHSEAAERATRLALLDAAARAGLRLRPPPPPSDRATAAPPDMPVTVPA